MSEETYNNQTVTQYLLGSLTEAEVERLDELSFTDDDFAEALKAAEKDLVDAYVRGELGGAALEQFQTHYLASPLRREKVRFSRALQRLEERSAGARAAEAPAESPAGPETKGKRRGWFSAFRTHATPRPAWHWGAAFAALALLVAGGWLAFENARLRRQVSQAEARRGALGERERQLQKELEDARSASADAAGELARVREERERLERELARLGSPASGGSAGQRPAPAGGFAGASFVLTPQMRGAGEMRTVSVPAGTARVAMRLELEPNDYGAYSVALLEGPDGRTLWRSGRLRARTAGGGQSVGVSFSAGLLRPRSYVLRVTGVGTAGASEIIGDYQFRVVK